MFAIRYTPTTVFRVSPHNAANALPPWQRVGGGRFDDPQHAFRVLYTSTSAEGAYTERFQDFRPSVDFKAIEDEFELDGSFESAPREVPTGVLAFDTTASLFIAEMSLPQDAELLDLTSDETARYFSERFGESLFAVQFAADGADGKYRLCPRVSRVGYEDPRRVAGIYSISKIAPVEIQNVTIYEGEPDALRIPAKIERLASVSHDDSALIDACNAIGVRIESPDEYHSRQISQYGY